MSESTILKRLVIHGRVQGVFFRDSVRDLAESLGVAGWARNLPDGSVEVVLEGPAEAVERIVRFGQQGPPQAQVEAVDVHEETPQGLARFEVR